MFTLYRERVLGCFAVGDLTSNSLRCGWAAGNLGTWGFGGEKLVVPDRKLVKVLPSHRHGIRGHTRQHRLIYKQPDQTQPGDSQNYHMAPWRAGRLGFVLAGECGLGSDDQSRAQGYRRGRHNSHTLSGRIMLGESHGTKD